jgi:regulator of protease activity HflC (stomatin/prohibitin superfamily)
MLYDYDYMMGRREVTSGIITIYPYQRGLHYKNGQFVGVLEAGRYRLWKFRHESIRVYDVRRTSAQIGNQKLMTRDQITVTLNLIADYEVSDIALAVQSVVDYKECLYADVQLVARDIVGSLTVDELLEKRSEINIRLAEVVAPLARIYGITVIMASIKDIVLAPRVRDLLMKEAEAKRVAQANLIGAREEVAAMRALANAAKLVADNPQIMRLRELEIARTFAGQGGNTLVMGLESASVSATGNGNGKRKAPATPAHSPEWDETADE